LFKGENNMSETRIKDIVFYNLSQALQDEFEKNIKNETFGSKAHLLLRLYKVFRDKVEISITKEQMSGKNYTSYTATVKGPWSNSMDLESLVNYAT
jgi:hypothetical protein